MNFLYDNEIYLHASIFEEIVIASVKKMEKNYRKKRMTLVTCTRQLKQLRSLGNLSAQSWQTVWPQGMNTRFF